MRLLSSSLMHRSMGKSAAHSHVFSLFLRIKVSTSRQFDSDDGLKEGATVGTVVGDGVAHAGSQVARHFLKGANASLPAWQRFSVSFFAIHLQENVSTPLIRKLGSSTQLKVGLALGENVGDMVGAPVGLGVSQDSTQFAGQFSINFFFLHLFSRCSSVSASKSVQKNVLSLKRNEVDSFSHVVGEGVGNAVGSSVGISVGAKVGDSVGVPDGLGV